jgi:type IVB pilus formation R64 PilN family outer membrane protein
MFKQWIVLLCASVFTLAACHSPVFNQTDANIADVKIKTAKERIKADNLIKPLPPLLIKDGPYVDTTPISLQKQPSWLNNHIVVRGDQLPFSYYSRLIAAGAGQSILTKNQVGLNATTNVSLNYSGTIRGALDLLAVRTGYVYSVRNNLIYWEAFVTRTYDIAFMPGDTDYLLGQKSGGGLSASGGAAQVTNYATSDASSSEYSNISGKVSLWKDLQDTIKQMLSPEGKLTVSQATTSVTVRDRPTNVQLVGQYIANVNHNLSKQVLVKVQVLEVDLENAFNYGIDWSIITKGFHNSPFQLKADYGTPIAIQLLNSATSSNTGATAVPLPTFGTQGDGSNPSWTILVKALNQQGKTAVVSEPRVLCLNNQVSVIRIVRSEGYLASIQNTALASTSTTTNVNASSTVTSQVTPGIVMTGITLYILPKILGSNVYLSVNADLSTNLGLKQFGPSNSQIQLPQVTQKSFNQRSMIKSGDTLILSGFRQLKNASGASQFLTSQSLGGTAAEQVNSETVVLITPIILAGSA